MLSSCAHTKNTCYSYCNHYHPNHPVSFPTTKPIKIQLHFYCLNFDNSPYKLNNSSMQCCRTREYMHAGCFHCHAWRIIGSAWYLLVFQIDSKLFLWVYLWVYRHSHAVLRVLLKQGLLDWSCMDWSILCYMSVNFLREVYSTYRSSHAELMHFCWRMMHAPQIWLFMDRMTLQLNQAALIMCTATQWIME